MDENKEFRGGRPLLSHAELLGLKRWSTPTIYNGWEQITGHDAAHGGFNLEEITDFLPRMGPMVGYAATVVIQPGRAEHVRENPTAWSDYRRYVASLPGPKIVVVQDLDKPDTLGAFWGEVNANIHRALGCAGSIIDGGIRDLDGIRNAGFKVLARRLCVGHAHSCPVRWDCEVEVFGCRVHPGQLIHADLHGFLAVPPEDEKMLLEAAEYMDRKEREYLISTARESGGKSMEQILEEIDRSAVRFQEEAARFRGTCRP